MTSENGNGHGEYQPVVSYQYLDADVWIKKDEVTGEETVIYTEGMTAEIFGEINSQEFDSDNN